jgi:hypothetical protein
MIIFLLKVLFIAIGISLGAIFGFYGLFGVIWLVGQTVEDQTGLGWTWVLSFISVPLGALLGGFAGYFVLKRFINSASENEGAVSDDT